MKPLFALLALSLSTFADPLPSWNETPTKKSVVAFVEKVTTAGSPDYIVPALRNAGRPFSHFPFSASKPLITSKNSSSLPLACRM